jgi:hypothetical protein
MLRQAGCSFCFAQYPLVDRPVGIAQQESEAQLRQGAALSGVGPRQLFQQQPGIHRFVQQPHMRIGGLAQAAG